MAIHIKDKNEFVQIMYEAGERLVVLDFFAPWCGPCKVMAPKLEELAREIPNLLVLKIDVNENEDLAMEYDVTKMPTFVFIRFGEIIYKFSGANYEKLRQTIISNV